LFTGIVGARGSVVDCTPGRLGLAHREVALRLSASGSVAVNGVCLTVTEVEREVFWADVVPETRRRTNLGQLQPGQLVNLELPLTLGRGLDGHLVQGHVDGTASVRDVSEVALGREMTIELPGELAPYVAEKGSIAVDGVSLTVARVDDEGGTFGVALIPRTLELTIASSYAPGTLVNLEVDLVARYVERLLRQPAAVRTPSGGGA
jgi:riboflavin synthase